MNLAERLAPAPGPPARSWQGGCMALKECRHGTLLYNTNDLFIGRSLDLYGEWCEAELELLGQGLEAGDVVLDVGANIGTHTLFFSRCVGPSGVVLAFEPQRLIFQNLCANLALNGVTNVHPYYAAVGDVDGSVFVPTLNPEREMNFGAVAVGEDRHGLPVKVLRVDDLELRRCDLIKVDVEGMEAAVLQGARDTIRRLSPVLFVENNLVPASAVGRVVEELDYAAYWHIRPYYSPGNFFGNAEDIFSRYQPEANVLCFHRRANFGDVAGFEPVLGPEDDWQAAAQRIREKLRGKAS